LPNRTISRCAPLYRTATNTNRDRSGP